MIKNSTYTNSVWDERGADLTIIAKGLLMDILGRVIMENDKMGAMLLGKLWVWQSDAGTW